MFFNKLGDNVAAMTIDHCEQMEWALVGYIWPSLFPDFIIQLGDILWLLVVIFQFTGRLLFTR